MRKVLVEAECTPRYRMSVLLLGDQCDPHVTVVRNLIANSGVECVIFDRNDASHNLTFSTEGDTSLIHFNTAVNLHRPENVSAVWWRLKQSGLPYRSGSHQWMVEDFAQSEWRPTLRSLPYLFPGHEVTWVNDVSSQARANLKPWQLKLAKSVGFRVPETCITNNPKDAERMIGEYGRIIYKTLSGYTFNRCEMVFTTLISAGELAEREANIRKAPCIFQRFIEKSYEFRVTVVGGSIFTARLNSQKLPETSLDWRRDQLADMYEVDDLPQEVVRKISAFQKAAGLSFAVYDLAVDKEGKVWFLECNPAGQWLWIEELLGIPISIALASLLTARE